MKKKATSIFWMLFIFLMGISQAQEKSVSYRLRQITQGEFKHIHIHWFPDGQRLVTSVMEGQTLTGFAVLQTESGELSRVLIGEGFSGDFYTSISPDGKWILFDGRRGDTEINIWKVGVQGRHPEQITQNGGIMPGWSPDGTQFVFVHDNDIYIKNLTTGEEKKVIDSGGADYHPAWSPDGKNLVFNPFINGNLEICVVSVTGDNMTNVSKNAGMDEYPAWSPDGSKVIFNSDRSGIPNLWCYDIKSRRLIQFTSGDAIDVCPTWSPDGSTIAFSSNRSGNLEVWTMAFQLEDHLKRPAIGYLGQKPPGLIPEVFAPGVISTKDHIEFAGTFSPDFKEFFFTRRKKGTIDNHIYHVKFEYNKLTEPELAPFSYDCFEFEPHISPNGRLLYYGTRRPIENSGVLVRGTNVWVVKKTSEGWSEPEYPGPPFDEAMFVCMAEDGTMYNSGISKSEPVNGKYGPWEKIAPHLHGPYMHPCIGPDESFIIFDTDHSLDGQGKSLLISFRKKDGSWGDIISFRKLDQFQHFEKFGIPMLPPDRKYLFFSNQDDIYWVDASIIEELKAKE